GGRALHRPCHRLGDGTEGRCAEDQRDTMVDRIGFGNGHTRRRLDGLAGTACDRAALVAVRSAHPLLVAVRGVYPCPAVPTFRLAAGQIMDRLLGATSCHKPSSGARGPVQRRGPTTSA